MITTNVCFHCGATLTADSIHRFDDRIMCRDCFDKLTVLCDCCLDRIWWDEAEGNRTVTLCSYCYENNYTNCANCDCLIHNDDACYFDDSDEPYCQDCRDKISDETILYPSAYYDRGQPV